MAQYRHTRIVLRELLFHTLGQSRSTARDRILSHDDDRRIFAFAEPVVDEFGQLVDLGLHFGNDGRLGTRCQRAVERQITGRMAHHLDEEEPFVARCRIAQFVHRIDDSVERRIVTDSRIGTAEIVVDRTWQPDDGNVVFIGEDTGTGQRTVAADDDQRIDTGRHHVVVGHLAAFGSGEFLATGRLENRSAHLDDVADALRPEIDDFVAYQSFVTAHDTFHGHSVVDGAARHGTYGRIHAGGIASGGQNTDSFDFCHNSLFFNTNRSKRKTGQR